MAGVEQDRVTLDRELAHLLADGEKIAVIKLLRERTGMGLAEAKDTVDRAAARGVVLALRTLMAVVVLGAAIWRALR